MRKALALRCDHFSQPLGERLAQAPYVIRGIYMLSALLEQGQELPLHVSHAAFLTRSDSF